MVLPKPPCHLRGRPTLIQVLDMVKVTNNPATAATETTGSRSRTATIVRILETGDQTLEATWDGSLATEVTVEEATTTIHLLVKTITEEQIIEVA